MAAQLGDDWTVGARIRQPFEQVCDSILCSHNHVELLDEAGATQRRFDPVSRTLRLSADLTPGQ